MEEEYGNGGRELEDKRAASAVWCLGSASRGYRHPAGSCATTEEPQEMMDMGLISAGEYEAKRAEILSKM
jgi:hypothetical protein